MSKSPNEDYTGPFCYECEYFDLDLGSYDWSKPLGPAFVGCCMEHWGLSTGDDGPRVFREKICLAGSCRDFVIDERAPRGSLLLPRGE